MTMVQRDSSSLYDRKAAGWDIKVNKFFFSLVFNEKKKSFFFTTTQSTATTTATEQYTHMYWLSSFLLHSLTSDSIKKNPTKWAVKDFSPSWRCCSRWLFKKKRRRKKKKNVGESVVTRIEGRNVWLLAINERGRDTTPSAVKWLAVKQKIVWALSSAKKKAHI